LPDKIKAAEAAMEDRRHGIGGLTVPESELARDPEYQVAQQQLTQLYNLQDSYQRSVRQEQGKQQPLEEAAGLAKQQFERAKNDYTAAAKISEETTHTIADLRAKLAGNTAKNDALQSVHDQTSAATAAGQNVDIAKRVAAGQGTPSEIAQVADWQSQARFAQTGAGDLSTVASNARAAMSDARSAVQSGHGNDSQLHGLMNEFIGLARDIHASATQRHEFNDLERQVETLRRQIAINRTSP
jgi:chromosome segregation ATPase